MFYYLPQVIVLIRLDFLDHFFAVVSKILESFGRRLPRFGRGNHRPEDPFLAVSLLPFEFRRYFWKS